METSEMIDIVLDNERAMNIGKERTNKMRMVQNLQNACEIFAKKSFKWIRGKHALKGTGRSRGFSANIPTVQKTSWKVDEKILKRADQKSITMLTCDIAGRILITLKTETTWISLCGSDSKKDPINAGLHGIGGNPEEALDILEYATQNWYMVEQLHLMEKNEHIAIGKK